MKTKTLFLGVLLTGIVGVFGETLLVAPLRERVASERRQVAQLEAQIRATRKQRDEIAAAQATIDDRLAGLRASVAAREARATSLRPWWSRIKQVQRRLDEMPEENIPELKLLRMKDWVEAVLYAETGTDADI